MCKKILLYVIISTIFLVTPKFIRAKVVINEFSSFTSDDWVELYADADTDISGWELQDNGSYKLTIKEGTTLGALQVVSFDTSNRLNKDGDTVKIYDSDGVLQDQISYGSDGGVCAAEDGHSIGRYPDGSGNIRRFSLSTRDALNTDTNADCPTPKPTPEPSSTETSTPEPTPTPIAVVLSSTTTPAPTLKKTSKPKASTGTSGKISPIVTEQPVVLKDPEVEASDTKDVKSNEAGIMIGMSGVFLLGAAGYNYMRVKKRNNHTTKDS